MFNKVNINLKHVNCKNNKMFNCSRYKTYITLSREGEQFRTPTNRPAEYDLTYSYPFAVVEEYFTAEKQWDESIDRLIAETSLAVPPHR